MKILALDTASARCAAAVLAGGTVRASLQDEMSRGQSERLIPLANAALAEARIGWRDLDAVAVGIGPGNFTGIRISVAAARGLAMALEIPAIGVSTFEALALERTGPTLVSLDAKRDRLYLQGFGAADLAPRLMDWADLHRLALPPRTLVMGHAADEIATLLGLTAGAGQTEPPPEAFAMVAASRRDPGPVAAPLYLRAADAALPADPPPPIIDEP